MNNLKKHKFSDLYDFSSGLSSSPLQAGHGDPFLSFSTVFNNYFVPETLPDLMNTSDKDQQKFSVREGDIFLTRTSETIDELGMSCVAIRDYPRATYSGFVKRLRPLQNEVTYHKFMAFYLRSMYFRKIMTNNAVLTLRASLNEQIFSYLDLSLPEYKDQKKIGDLLFLLTDKMKANEKINAELEKMAKTLYNYWFVQFNFPDENGKPYKSCGGEMIWNTELNSEIPKEWIVKELGDIISKSGTGLNPRKNFELGHGKNFYITIKNLKNGKIIFDDSCEMIDDEAL
jgi:type I restriction enzyme S subunit